MLGMAGYEASLDYAKQRDAGPPRRCRRQNVEQKPVPIIEHADVKRMLLAQKAYSEGALALELYCARLVDETHTGEGDALADQTAARSAHPIAKSWPSRWCLEANSLAIQIHGGYGYTRDFPVEQYWRDNRLNMIHEGAHGIQALDLLGRKVVMDGGKGLTLLANRMNDTIMKAMHDPALADHAQALARATQRGAAMTKAAWATGNRPRRWQRNALSAGFGHTVLAWIWLDVVLALPAAGDNRHAHSLRANALPCATFHHELPKIDAWLCVVSSRDMTCATFVCGGVLMKRDDVLRMIGAVLMFAGGFSARRAPRGAGPRRFWVVV